MRCCPETIIRMVRVKEPSAIFFLKKREKKDFLRRLRSSRPSDVHSYYH